MSASGEITVRRLQLSFPAGLDPEVIAGFPEESFTIVGLSLLLPYLEPYLIRTMRAARSQVTDPALLSDLDLFNGQEGQHYRQHIRFNQAVAVHGRGFAALPALEAQVSADYQRFTATRSLRWNLAYAEGFEAFTSAMASFSFEVGQLDRMEPVSRELFQWHLVEELEHRTVTFDVYDHVCGGYFYRLFVGMYAQWHLNRFVWRAALAMRDGDPAAFRAKHGGARRAFARLRPLLWLVVSKLYPRILSTYLPWYTPHRIPLSEDVKALAARYTAEATRVAGAGAEAPARAASEAGAGL